MAVASGDPSSAALCAAWRDTAGSSVSLTGGMSDAVAYLDAVMDRRRPLPPADPLPAVSSWTGDPNPVSAVVVGLTVASSTPRPPPSPNSSQESSSSLNPSSAWLRNHWSSARVSCRRAGSAAAACWVDGGDAAAIGMISARAAQGPRAVGDTAAGLALTVAVTAGACCLTGEAGCCLTLGGAVAVPGACCLAGGATAVSARCMMSEAGADSGGGPRSGSANTHPSPSSSSSSARLRLRSLGRGRSSPTPSSSLPPEQQASSPPSLPPPPENVASAGKRAGTEAGASRSGAGTAREALCLTGHPGAAAASFPTAAAAGPWAGAARRLTGHPGAAAASPTAGAARPSPGTRAAVPLATASPASAIIGADPSCRRILLTMSAAMLLSVVAARRPGGMRFCRAGPEGGRAPPLTTSAATPYVESPRRARLPRLPCCGSSVPLGVPESASRTRLLCPPPCGCAVLPPRTPWRGGRHPPSACCCADGVPCCCEAPFWEVHLRACGDSRVRCWEGSPWAGAGGSSAPLLLLPRGG